MDTLSAEERQKIADYLATHELPSGLGSEESACSIAAINLSLYGLLSDTVPACMSNVIGRWIITTQDAMPAAMRNSMEWKRLLPLAAGTGRDPDAELRRLKLAMNWMWEIVLPELQSIADERGFGSAWQTMTNEKTDAAARAADAAAAVWAADAWAAADAAARATAAAAADAAAAAWAAAWAADAAARAARAAARAARAAAWAADAAARAARAADAAAAAWAADAWAAADAAARAAARAAAWAKFDPCALLAKMIEA